MSQTTDISKWSKEVGYNDLEKVNGAFSTDLLGSCAPNTPSHLMALKRELLTITNGKR